MPLSNADHDCLYRIAAPQHGYFTTKQAAACGFGGHALTYFVQDGRFQRMHRGVYRLRNYPPTEFEEITWVWLAVGKDDAVVSHESALEIHELSDIIPNAVHLTVPRSKRYRMSPPGARIHTTVRPLPSEHVVTRQGIRVVTPERAIVEAADAGVGPEQIEMAVRQGLDRGITTPKKLRETAEQRDHYVQGLIERSISLVRA